MKLVQTCLCVGNTLQRRFHRRGSAVKHVQACLSARKDQFSPMGKSCEAGTSLFICAKHRTSPFSPSRRCCEARAGLFKFQKRCRKQFSPLCGGPMELVQACLSAGNTLQRRLTAEEVL